MNIVRRFFGWWSGIFKKAGIFGKLILVFGSVFFLCFICSIPVAILSPSTPTPAADSVEKTVAALVMEQQPTINISTPTIEIKPTETSEPTPTLVVLPDPILLQGSGASIVDFDLTIFGGSAVARFVNSGSGNFAAWTLDANNEQMDLLINTIGQYDGFIPINFMKDETSSRFQVQSDGIWQIQLIPLEMIKQSRNVAKGSTYQSNSDDVVFVSGSPAIASFKTDSSGNFAVWSFEDDRGRDLLINEIGPYSGVVPFRAGLFLITVKADGPWQVEVK